MDIISRLKIRIIRARNNVKYYSCIYDSNLYSGVSRMNLKLALAEKRECKTAFRAYGRDKRKK